MSLCLPVSCVFFVFITPNVIHHRRELYKSMTATTEVYEDSTESLNASGFEDAERMKVGINRINLARQF